MTSTALLVLAAVAAAVALWCSFARTSAALPPTVLGIIFLVISVGGPVWEWSKWAEGAGLPPNVPAPAFGEAVAAQAFLWASIGASLSALLIPQSRRASVPTGTAGSTWAPPRSLSIGLLILSSLSFVGWVIGSGPSFFRREVYTQSDGNDFLLRASFPFGVIVGLIALTVVAVEKDRLLRALLIAVATLEFVGLIGIGSRTALAFPIIGAVLVIRNEVKRRRIHPLAVLSATFLLLLPIAGFGVVKQARSMPHGMFNIPTVAHAYFSDALASTDSFLLPLKQLTASIFAAFPIGEQSATYGVGLNVLVANANVLPGTGQAMELERYWPYEWIPLCFAGTWYGAAGWAGQLILFAAVGWMTGYTAYNLQRGRFRFLSVLPLGMAILIGLLSIQYPSRMVWRVISLAATVLVMSYLTRDRRQNHPPGIPNFDLITSSLRVHQSRPEVKA